MNSVQAVLVEVLRALCPGFSTLLLQGYAKHRYRADDSATVVLMDVERCRLVAVTEMDGVQGLKELKVTTYLAPHDPCHSPQRIRFTGGMR